ncbi:MAG: tail fiber domain-containing protein [Bacteroidia bacterium]|nr:tail fiber domain-containing protein [Bacteroidia bacterium]
MKKIILLSFVLLGLRSFAQSPDKMSYQAVIRNNSNALVTNTTVGMRISIIQGSLFGASVYVETQTPATNANGLISIEIGSGTPVNGTMAAINWANGPYFIKTETDPTGGTNYTITGTSQLLSVPYALYAKKTGFDGDSSATNELQTLSKTGNTITLSNGGGSVSVTPGSDGDTSATNELQTISKTGNTVTLSNGGGSFSVDDADANPNNELQVISQSGLSLTLSNGGGTVSIADGDTSFWKKNSSNIYFNQGHVGIGNTNPLHRLHLNGAGTYSSALGSYTGALMEVTGGNVSTNFYHGLRVDLTSAGDGIYRGIAGIIHGTSTQSCAGIFGRSDSSSLINRGVNGLSSGSGLYNQGVFGRSDGNGDNSGNSQNMGCFGYATNNYNTNYGVAGQADGSNGVNYGVWGYATGGSANYAGYFNGNVTVTGTFSNPSDIKLKKNIADLESPLAKIMKLKVKSYEYVIDSTIQLPKGKQFGFIAQDMETLFPELVHVQKQANVSVNGEATSMFEYKAINYMGMIPVLTRALQEQQLLIEQLQQRIAALEMKK